jgi:hypothetical protein
MRKPIELMSNKTMNNKKIKLGLSGVGDFAEKCFIELFQNHPMVESLAIADFGDPGAQWQYLFED